MPRFVILRHEVPEPFPRPSHWDFMLEAGEVPIVADYLREADEDNPKGYFEYEPVKSLDKEGDKGWVGECRGKVIKVISFLLPHLPLNLHYKVIFMRRNLDEVIASQNKMIERRGEKAPVEFISPAGISRNLGYRFDDALGNIRDHARKMSGGLRLDALFSGYPGSSCCCSGADRSAARLPPGGDDSLWTGQPGCSNRLRLVRPGWTVICRPEPTASIDFLKRGAFLFLVWIPDTIAQSWSGNHSRNFNDPVYALI